MNAGRRAPGRQARWFVIPWYGSCAPEHPCVGNEDRLRNGGAFRSERSSPRREAGTSASGRRRPRRSRSISAIGGSGSIPSPTGTTPGSRLPSRREPGTRTASMAGPAYPDPASRFQPDGPHGPSEVVDPAAFRWTDRRWPGIPREGQVVYELHVGTFTAAGTWDAASRELPELARAGITVVEVLPVADFVGDFGWGYDGVDLFAPTRLYGRPDDFRAFVDRAHAVGVGVILDVVYNHLGPDGNYLGQYAPGLLHRPSPDGLGLGDQLRRRGLRAGPRVLRLERRLLDRRVPPRRAPAGRHAGHPRRFPGARADGDRAPGAGARRPAIGVPRRRERAAGREARPPGGGRRLRPRRPVERRLPPHRDGRPHGARRGVLQRPRRDPPGAHLGRQARVSLPGAAIRVAREAPRHTRVGRRADLLRQLPPEPRPGRQLAGRAPLPSADQPRPATAP